MSTAERSVSDERLEDGSRIAVVGGGPAGSFFSYFALGLAERFGTELSIDVFEPKDFSGAGPKGCNKCAGIISESLVQLLAAEGVRLPPGVVQRGIDSYVLHTDAGSVQIATPLEEKRIGAVHRGGGPRGSRDFGFESFDGFLLGLAEERGARVIRERVENISWREGRPFVGTKGKEAVGYDLLVAATGINSTASRLYADLGLGYQPPQATQTSLREFFLGAELVEKHLGNSMHVFLLAIPRLEFAAIVPKGDYASVCLLGRQIDAALVNEFLSSREARACFPPNWDPLSAPCQCWPNINVMGMKRPWADRIVFVGDSGVARLYKDGIGSAYRTAKAAASTAVLHGVSAAMFEKHYRPVCRSISRDNAIGKAIFGSSWIVQRLRFARRAIVRTVAFEQAGRDRAKRLSSVLWDMFTGSAPYKEAMAQGLHPGLALRFGLELALSLLSRRAPRWSGPCVEEGTG